MIKCGLKGISLISILFCYPISNSHKNIHEPNQMYDDPSSCSFATHHTSSIILMITSEQYSSGECVGAVGWHENVVAC